MLVDPVLLASLCRPKGGHPSPNSRLQRSCSVPVGVSVRWRHACFHWVTRNSP